VQFRLSYNNEGFSFWRCEIKGSDPEKGIQVVYKKRPDDGKQLPTEANDGLIVATCVRELTDRREAASSGELSLKKAAVQKVFDDMVDVVKRTLRLVRWKANSVGGPNPIRSTTTENFVWPVEGSNWKRVSDAVFGRLTLNQRSCPIQLAGGPT
jgi:hypothetical protein